MLSLFLFLFPAAQEPAEQLRASSITSAIQGKIVTYQLKNFELDGKEIQVRADLAILQLERGRYEEILGPEIAPKLGARILGGLGEPADDTLVLYLDLKGNVKITLPSVSIVCERWQRWPQKGTSLSHQTTFHFPSGDSLNGWPWSLKAETVHESATGQLLAKDCRITTCAESRPHYSVKMATLLGTPYGAGNYAWDPSWTWLEIAGIPVLPLPAPVFGGEETGLGLDSLQILTGRRWGNGIRVGFASSAELGQGKLNWHLKPGWSSERGLPLELLTTFDNTDFRSSLELFQLSDEGDDIHPFRTQVGKSGTDRLRVRWNNRWQLGNDWQLDADLAWTSDPLVDPEFFRRQWISQNERLSQLYLQHTEGNRFFEARADYRLDDVGFTPLIGFGPGKAPPLGLELLPSLRYRQYPSAWVPVNVGPLSPSGKSNVDVSWDLELSRLQLRPYELVAANGKNPFEELETLARDRARWQAEIAMPLSWHGLQIKPHFQVAGAYWNDPQGQNTSTDGYAFAEWGLSLSTHLRRDYEGGWGHTVKPQIRLFDRRQTSTPETTWVEFDRWDAQRPGKGVELGVRQLWYSPNKKSPWLDLQVMAPWYPEKPDGQQWGLLECQTIWSPQVGPGFLQSISASARIRRALEEGDQNETFARASLSPIKNWRFGIGIRDIEDEVSIVIVSASATLTERWSLQLAQTIVERGNAAKSTRYGLVHRGHDFFFTLAAVENEATGEKRFQFDFSPLFLSRQWRPGL